MQGNDRKRGMVKYKVKPAAWNPVIMTHRKHYF